MTEPHYTDGPATIYAGDCIDVMRELPDTSVDAVVTDPPYGLEFMGKAWDKYTPGDFQHWCEQWAREAYRLLKPGGHLLAFGGTRTFHRLTAGIEDAGFEIRDSIAWLYGSGFPKSLDVAKAIDKSRTDVDEIEEVRAFLNAARVAKGLPVKAIQEHFGFAGTGGGLASHWTTNRTTKGVPNWEQWVELKSWLGFDDYMDATVQRLEATRLEGTDAWNARPVAEHAGRPGMATSWSNGIGWNGAAARGGAAIRPEAQEWEGWGTALKPAFEPIVVARKPLTGTVAANVLAYGTGALNIDASRIGTPDGKPAYSYPNGAGGHSFKWNETENQHGPKEGSAGGRWPSNVILDASQAAALDQQSGTSTSRVGKPRGAAAGEGWGMTATGAEYDDQGGASRFFYTAKAPGHERPEVDGTSHPTVKPLDLMQWLVKLVTPKGGTVLEPFAGSGTTVEACIREGFNCIAIEREPDYLPLILKRIRKDHAVGFDFGDWDGAA